MQTTQHVDIAFDKCTIVRINGRDHVSLRLATHDMFGHEIPHMQNLHAGHDEYNDRCLKIDTVLGKGPKLARLLGWALEIEIVGPHALLTVDAWDFDCRERPY